LGKRNIFIYLFVFLCSAIVAQPKGENWYLIKNVDEKKILASDKPLLDSVLKVYHASKNDSIKLDCLDFLSENLVDEAMWSQYSRLIVSYKWNKPSTFLIKLKSNAYNNLALFEFNTGQSENAIKNFSRSFHLDSIISNFKGLTNSLYNLAYLYEKTGSVKATQYFTASIKVAEKINSQKDIARGKTGLASIYFDIGEDAYALKLTLEGIEIRKKINDYEGLVTSYNNLGNYYHNLHNHQRAYYFYMKSLSLRDKATDAESLITNLNNIGSLFLQWKDYVKAKEYYDEALVICKGINNVKMLAYCSDNMSSLYQATGDWDKAEKNALVTLQIGQKLVSYELMLRAADYLHRIYKVKKDYKRSLQMFELEVAMKAKVSASSQQKGILKEEYQREFEKKEADVKAKALAEKEVIQATNREEKKRMKVITISISIGFVMVLILAIVIFRSLRINRKKNAIISEQKMLVETKNKEVLDSILYAKRIQTALITNEKYIEKELNKLQNKKT
jgi:tetratricopeptide (TPR) repeat protein